MLRLRPILPVLLACLALVSLAGCHATFDVNVKSNTTVKRDSGGIFGGLLADSFGDFSSIDLSQTQDFKNAGVRKEDVESVKLHSAVLTVTAPATGTFEFLDSIEFYVETDGQPKKRIAHKENIPNDAKTVTLDVDDVELAPYVTAPKLSVTTNATAHAPQQDTTIQAALAFTVDPKIL